MYIDGTWNNSRGTREYSNVSNTFAPYNKCRNARSLNLYINFLQVSHAYLILLFITKSYIFIQLFTCSNLLLLLISFSYTIYIYIYINFFSYTFPIDSTNLDKFLMDWQYTFLVCVWHNNNNNVNNICLTWRILYIIWLYYLNTIWHHKKIKKNKR